MYKTKQGECWDEVAKKVYGSEKYTGYLMQNNLPLLDIAVFLRERWSIRQICRRMRRIFPYGGDRDEQGETGVSQRKL